MDNNTEQFTPKNEPQINQPESVTQNSHKKKHSKKLYILLLLASFLLIACLAYLILNKITQNRQTISDTSLVNTKKSSNNRKFYFEQNNYLKRLNEDSVDIETSSKIFEDYDNNSDTFTSSPNQQKFLKIDHTKDDSNESGFSVKIYISDASMEPKFEELKIEGIANQLFRFAEFSKDSELILIPSRNEIFIYNIADKSTRKINISYKNEENSASIIDASLQKDVIYWLEFAGRGSAAIETVHAQKISDSSVIALPSISTLESTIQSAELNAFDGSIKDNKLFFNINEYKNKNNNDGSNAIGNFQVKSYDLTTGEIIAIYDSGDAILEPKGLYEVPYFTVSNDMKYLYIEKLSAFRKQVPDERIVEKHNLNNKTMETIFKPKISKDDFGTSLVYKLVVYNSSSGALVQFYSCPEGTCSVESKTHYEMNWISENGEITKIYNIDDLGAGNELIDV